MSSLPIIVFACDLFTLCCAMSAIFNTVSLHSTAFDHCTVRYGTVRVGRYGHIHSYLNNSSLIIKFKGIVMKLKNVACARFLWNSLFLRHCTGNL